jgi:hypothetical protein
MALGSRFRAHPAQPSRWTLDYDPMMFWDELAVASAGNPSRVSVLASFQ